MDEFTDIYRIYAKNCNIDLFEESWNEKDFVFLKNKLDKIKPVIENGDLIIDILKRELDNNYDCPPFTTALESIALTLFEIEKRINSGSKPDFFVPQDQEVTVEVDKEVEKEDFKPEINNEIEKTEKLDYATSGIPPFEEVLYHFKNTTIYKEVYDHLLETLPDKFDFDNIYDIIQDLYVIKPKRKLTHKTLLTYASRYKDYMMMNKKIEVDRKSGMIVKISEKETPEPKTETTKKERWGEWSGLFPKDQILAKYNTVYIYRPIVDVIMKDLPDEFTKKDLGNFLHNYFHDVLKKKLSITSATVYRSRYVKYLVVNNLVKIERTIDGTKLVKTKKKEPSFIEPVHKEKQKTVSTPKDEKLKEEPSEKNDNKKPVIAIKEPAVEKPIITIEGIDDVPEKPPPDEEMQQPVMFATGETLDEAIYNYALGCGFKTSVLVIAIARRFPEYASDEIKIALAKLITEGKAFQTNPDRIKFLGVDKE